MHDEISKKNLQEFLEKSRRYSREKYLHDSLEKSRKFLRLRITGGTCGKIAGKIFDGIFGGNPSPHEEYLQELKKESQQEFLEELEQK